MSNSIKNFDHYGIEQTQMLIDAMYQFMENGLIDESFITSITSFSGNYKKIGQQLIELFFQLESQKNRRIQEELMQKKVPQLYPKWEDKPPVSSKLSKKIRVIVFDDNTVRLNTIKKKFNHQRDIELLATFDSAIHVVEECQRWSPDIVVMDMQMPGIDGIEATQRIVKRFGEEIAVVIVSVYNSPYYVFKSMVAGAQGYLTKTDGMDKLPTRLRMIYEGDYQMNQEVCASFIRYMRYRSILTNTQMEVFAGVLQGKSRELLEKELEMSKEALRQNIYRIGKALEVKEGEIGIREHFFSKALT